MILGRIFNIAVTFAIGIFSLGFSLMEFLKYLKNKDKKRVI